MGDLITAERLLKDFFDQGRIGWEDGLGLQRMAYSQAYFEARSWLSEKMANAGLKTRMDGVGNLFGRLEGKTEKTILIGSHLDSVNNGGIYDGPLGIIAAVEILRSVKEKGMRLNHSLEVVAFIGEEGEPLGGTFGSRAFAGMLPSGYRRELLDPIGIKDDDIKWSKGVFDKYSAFLELHIEQGPFLERQKLAIGIPSGIVGITRLDVTVNGKANHAGTTPMCERKDAMRDAAELISKWFAWADCQEGLVCNIGVLDITPGHVSVVPEKVHFVLELRSIDDSLMEQGCIKIAELAELPHSCSVSIATRGVKPAVLLDKNLVAIIKESAERAGLPFAVMPSGASHDSSPIAHVIPTGMIFVPSRGGVSHSKEEFTSEDDILRGAELLSDVVMAVDAQL